MAQVTGGVVKYARKVQKAQFEPVDAAVELTFALDEGERDFEDALDQYANAAVQKVHVMLGIAAPKPAPVAERPKDLDLSGRIQMTPAVTKNDGMTWAEHDATMAGERTKADLAAEKIAEVSDPASLEPSPPKRKGRPPKNTNSDPAAIDPSPAASAPAQQTEAADPAAIDPEPPSKEDGGGSDPASLDGDVFSAAAPGITDGELQAMIAAHNAKTQATQAIRELIGKYTGGPPKTFRDIPQEVRAKFREELESIKAPATAA